MNFDLKRFNAAYDALILGDHFFEKPSYYRQQRSRYRNTLIELQRAGWGRPAKVLEIGGGLILLLGNELFGFHGTVADVGDRYAEWIRQHNIDFVVCDLVHDDLNITEEFDLVVLCEVIEHIPIPQHLVLEKIHRWLKPNGALYLTTPNLYRFRNLVRLATHRPIFCPLLYPEPGQSLGHPCEFSDVNLRWQLEKAGFSKISAAYRQLANRGASAGAQMGRVAAAPLFWLRPSWRDNLVVVAAK